MTQDVYSTNVRFPGEMKERIQQAAEAEFRSVNGLIVAAVSNHLREHDRRRGELSQEPEDQEAG